ncbi:MAG: DUF1848 domain-containing protein [Sedimentisphaerales bacterium]|nr:DUF1848 domain-containing protein [Sedimentisphaerales bacterium]
MKRIISVSRRTDIPAFYGDWFMGRVREGFAGVVNPFGGKRYLVSLRPEDALCLVFWSKDFSPFVDALETLDRLGYRFYFNYTVTGLPALFETGVDKGRALRTVKLLSERYGPATVTWRFDPIIFSTISDADFYVETFTRVARELEGLVERCTISFVTEYGKVKRNFRALERAAGVRVVDPGPQAKIDLANQLAQIAAGSGMTMHSCCGDYLVGEKIQKAHCVNGALIERLFYPEGLSYQAKPTRPECGCTESVDIGTYDTCPHGCVYCYANANKTVARDAFARHDPAAAFLGYSKAQSDEWLTELHEQSLL